jgi:aryl-alcohol dehydrogenase-like predicted oxidoreductase
VNLFLHYIKQFAAFFVFGKKYSHNRLSFFMQRKENQISGFSSPEELEAALAAASTELHETTGKLKAVESTLREKKDLQKQLLAYIKTNRASGNVP